MTLRRIEPADIAPLQELLAGIDLFPPEMLPDLAAPALSGDPDHHIFVGVADGEMTGLAWFRAEEMAENVWAMIALGVSASCQRAGWGRHLLAYGEGHLRALGARLMIVDTSALDDFAPARAFYAAQGYSEVARIENFWAPGDAKVTFAKTLLPA